MSETGSPPKLKSEKAIRPTTSITRTPCSSRRMTNAIMSIHPHPVKIHGIHRRELGRDALAHRPRDELLVDVDRGQLAVGEQQRLADGRVALRGLALDPDLVDQPVHL